METLLAAEGWGDLAAARLSHDWVARVWEAGLHGVLLVDHQGELLRLVPTSLGHGPFHVLLPDGAASAWTSLPRALPARYERNTHRLWVGEGLAIQLPVAPPWQSHLSWRQDEAFAPTELVSRHLALLGDWLLARAPESTLASLLPDLLVTGGASVERAAQRTDLPIATRLFRWRAARALDNLLPALAVGDLAVAESAARSLGGLGGGSPSAGDWFVLGLIAGLQLWPPFLDRGSGLRAESLVQRLTRNVIEQCDLLGQATLLAALDGRWAEPWHALYHALTALGPYPDDLRDQLLAVAAAWLEQDSPGAGAALAGLLAPFLWYQRFLTP